MKNLLFSLLFSLLASSSFAWEKENKTLFGSLSLADGWNSQRCSIWLNMQGVYTLNFNNGNFQEGKFVMRQLRIEAKGYIRDWLWYRYRQRLNRTTDGSGNMDNLPAAIDYAGLGVRLSSSCSFFAGKQCAAYGGIEFDLNPIEVYQYSDMLEYMTNFMTGVNFIYDLSTYHQFQFQLLDSRPGTLEQMYGSDKGIEAAKLSLLYTLNWNGSFGTWGKTRWSLSFMNETKGEHLYYVALGNSAQWRRWSCYLDVLYSREGLDRKGIVSEIVGKSGLHLFSAEYFSLILHGGYEINSSWRLVAKGMVETASLYRDNGDYLKGRYRTSWGYIGGVEYYPTGENLHFFLVGIGRSFLYSSMAKVWGNRNERSLRVEVGMIYQLPVL